MALVKRMESTGDGHEYKGIMLLRHDLLVTSDVLFSEALKGVPKRALVIPRQCGASGVTLGRNGRGSCGNLNLKRAGIDYRHELDWLWFASSSTVLYELAEVCA